MSSSIDDVYVWAYELMSSWAYTWTRFGQLTHGRGPANAWTPSALQQPLHRQAVHKQLGVGCLSLTKRPLDDGLQLAPVWGRAGAPGRHRAESTAKDGWMSGLLVTQDESTHSQCEAHCLALKCRSLMWQLSLGTLMPMVTTLWWIQHCG